MKRISINSVQPGDILFTARPGKISKSIRFSTGGIVSHAMICVQHGSFIDSTADGVQARNPQRELFEDDEQVFHFRLKEALPREVLSKTSRRLRRFRSFWAPETRHLAHHFRWSHLSRPCRRRGKNHDDGGRHHGTASSRPHQQGDADCARPLPGTGRARVPGALSTARILVADETNFTKDKRARFLSRAATANWDAIIINHSAFRFIGVPSAFEQQMINDEVELYEKLLLDVDDEDRVSRKRLERLKEALQERLEALSTRKDDLLTISEIGVDQIVVDEAQEFRKLSFATNMSTLKGVDPNGSQRAWDLYVKSRFIETKNPGRALVLASGTPITNTLGEMFSVQRLMGHAALMERGLHEFDAWASTFGDTTTELELQPSGKYKPVSRFASFVNVPELIAMFRAFADVVMPEDLRQYVKVPSLSTGKRQILTSKPTQAFKHYQTCSMRASRR